MAGGGTDFGRKLAAITVAPQQHGQVPKRRLTGRPICTCGLDGRQRSQTVGELGGGEII